MPSVLFRLQDFAAERVRWVQFPRQQFIPAKPKAPFFKYQMPLWKRFGLMTFGLFVLTLMLPIFALIALLFVAAFRVVFTSG